MYKEINFGIHKIFVEGKSDQVFLRDIILTKYKVDFSQTLNDSIINVNGFTNIINYRNKLNEDSRKIQGGKNIIILDTDKRKEQDFSGRIDRLKWLETNLKGINYCVFLWPDDISNEGNLETVLKTCIIDKFGFIFDCFDQFEDCLKSVPLEPNLKTPDDKTKLFSYNSFLKPFWEDSKNDANETKRNYLDKGIWNLDFEKNEYLKKLVNFLDLHLQ